MPLITDPDSARSFSCILKVNKEKVFSVLFYLLLTVGTGTTGTFLSVFSYLQVNYCRSQGFSKVFCLLMEGSGSESVQINTDPEGPKT